jgi:hypothetical protein
MPREAPVASPVVVATAEPGMAAESSDVDEVVGAIPAAEPAEAVPSPEAAGGERKEKDETQRWVPAFSIYSGVLLQNAEGAVFSGGIEGPCAIRDTNFDTLHCERQIRPTIPPVGRNEEPPPIEFVTTTGDDLMVAPFVAGSLELMTPGLTSVPGRPRLFVHADAAASFSFTRDLAKESFAGEFEVAPNVDFPNEQTILGQGSTLTAEVKPLLISAGTGVAFTVDAWDRRLRIKPSVEYLREEIEVTGVVKRQVYDGSVEVPTTEDFPDGFRAIELSGSKKDVFHGLGPGLEIEADAGRAGPLVLAVYVAGQAYAFLGDLEMEFSDTNEFDETATWRFEKERWGYRAGVGLRFRWVPE